MQRDRRRHPFLPYLIALLTSLLYMLFHLRFLQLFLDYDQLVYFKNIIFSLQAGEVSIYNPHHLHFELGGVLFHGLAVRYLGSSGFTDLMFNLRLRSLLVACVGVFFTILYLKEMTGSTVWAVLGGLLIAFSHGYLHNAPKVDTGVFPAGFFPVLLWMVQRLEKARRGLLLLSIFGGLILGLAVLLHQYLAFACAAACLTLLIPNVPTGILTPKGPLQIIAPKGASRIDVSPATRVLSVTVVALVGLAIAFTSYLYVGKVLYNLSFDEPTQGESRGLWRDSTFQQWLFAYQASDKWGYGLKHFYPKHPFRGFTDSYLSQKEGTKYSHKRVFNYNLAKPSSEQSFSHNLLALFCLITLVGTVCLLPSLLARYRRSMVFLLLTGAIYFVFFTYWEPFYFEFWLVPSIIFSALCVLLLSFLGERLSSTIGRIGRLPFYTLLLLFLTVFSFHNMLYYVVPHSRHRFMEGVLGIIEPEFYTRSFSREVYRHPDDIYRGIREKRTGE